MAQGPTTLAPTEPAPKMHEDDRKANRAATMKALVYLGVGKGALVDRPKPEIQAPGDAIVKIVKTTICGTDLHILKGDLAELRARPHPRPRRRRRDRQRRRRRSRRSRPATGC